MPRTITRLTPIALTNTLLVGASGPRVNLRLTNKSDRVNAYVTQNATATISSGGNLVLHPSDTLLLEGAAATGAWYVILDPTGGFTGSVSVVVEGLDPH